MADIIFAILILLGSIAFTAIPFIAVFGFWFMTLKEDDDTDA